MNNVFVGYDSREDEAWKVCFSSIIKRTDSNCKVTPIIQQELRKNKFYRRPIDAHASTEFSLTRFLVPFLMQYEGWAVYCDCDFLWLDDIDNLLSLADSKYAVQVVKHEYSPTNTVKMDGKAQHLYPRKNWSSMVLWNCGHPSNYKVDLDLVNNATPAFLHRFQWLNDFEIGSLSVEWNWLVGWYNKEEYSPKAVHFTEGGPWMKGYESVDFAEEWVREYNELNLPR